MFEGVHLTLKKWCSIFQANLQGHVFDDLFQAFVLEV